MSQCFSGHRGGFYLDAFAKRIHERCISDDGFMHHNCVAICVHDCTMYIASNRNNVKMQDSIEQEIFSKYDCHHYTIVEGRSNQHAEIKIFDFIRSKFEENPGYIGISKPLCAYCQATLDYFTIGHRRGDSRVGGSRGDWVVPEAVSDDDLDRIYDAADDIKNPDSEYQE